MLAQKKKLQHVKSLGRIDTQQESSQRDQVPLVIMSKDIVLRKSNNFPINMQ